ncbi:hypothetical protein TRFO_05984 [Tritrichomonas foetus]|uniref:Myb-like DNA-binding domain containing protein n=1 Tax=Tritrichomonas foetus TaxID=1144522 RepID=A0A1J4K2G3_9EUKA|nr:hypothetical protein TRFO_05984 [Tritrichomonas foetus]|eukprot:OHT05387.1 hypothetical protein TRFO_05984 [Tritrichomonas foetus]
MFRQQNAFPTGFQASTPLGLTSTAMNAATNTAGLQTFQTMSHFCSSHGNSSCTTMNSFNSYSVEPTINSPMSYSSHFVNKSLTSADSESGSTSKPTSPKSYSSTSMKIKFTEEEDQRLKYFVRLYGTKNWNIVSRFMGSRNARQCRERYNNYLNPKLRKEAWSPEEDRLLSQKYAEFGARWNKIAKFFKNRSDINIRNRCMLIERRKAKLAEKYKPAYYSVPTPPNANCMPNMNFNGACLQTGTIDKSDMTTEIWEVNTDNSVNMSNHDFQNQQTPEATNSSLCGNRTLQCDDVFSAPYATKLNQYEKHETSQISTDNIKVRKPEIVAFDDFADFVDFDLDSWDVT